MVELKHVKRVRFLLRRVRGVRGVRGQIFRESHASVFILAILVELVGFHATEM